MTPCVSTTRVVPPAFYVAMQRCAAAKRPPSPNEGAAAMSVISTTETWRCSRPIPVGPPAASRARGIQGLEALVVHVRVAVDQAGDDGASAKLDPFRASIGQPADLFAAAERQYAPVSDRQCLMDARALVQRHDTAAAQNDV